MSIPDAKDFKLAIEIASNYLDIRGLAYSDIESYIRQSMTCPIDVVMAYEKIRIKVLKQAINSFDCITWLIDQPAFKLAYGDLVTYAYSDRLELINTLLNSQPLDLSAGLSVHSPLSDYRLIYLLTELSKFIYLYLGDGYIVKATEAKKEILELRKLLVKVHKQVDRIKSLQWQPEGIEQIALPLVDFNRFGDQHKSIKELNNILRYELVTTRKDTTIKERLFTMDVLKLNLTLFNDFNKGRAYKILSLPFIENELDHVTINRLITQFKDRL